METRHSLYEIETALAKLPEFDYRRNIVAFNVTGISRLLPIFHECDMLVCSKAGYLTEIEIKRSKKDFVADMAKKKHSKDSHGGIISKFYYCLPASVDMHWAFDLLNEHGIEYSGLYFYDEDLRIHGIGARIRNDIDAWYCDRKIGNPCKLYLEQQLELARLGAMRAVGLKEKILKLSAKVAELSDDAPEKL